MRATIIHGAGDIRVENVGDPQLQEPTDAAGYASCWPASAEVTCGHTGRCHAPRRANGSATSFSASSRNSVPTYRVSTEVI